MSKKPEEIQWRHVRWFAVSTIKFENFPEAQLGPCQIYIMELIMNI